MTLLNILSALLIICNPESCSGSKSSSLYKNKEPATEMAKQLREIDIYKDQSTHVINLQENLIHTACHKPHARSIFVLTVIKNELWQHISNKKFYYMKKGIKRTYG